MHSCVSLRNIFAIINTSASPPIIAPSRCLPTRQASNFYCRPTGAAISKHSHSSWLQLGRRSSGDIAVGPTSIRSTMLIALFEILTFHKESQSLTTRNGSSGLVLSEEYWRLPPRQARWYFSNQLLSREGVSNISEHAHSSPVEAQQKYFCDGRVGK